MNSRVITGSFYRLWNLRESFDKQSSVPEFDRYTYVRTNPIDSLDGISRSVELLLDSFLKLRPDQWVMIDF